MPRKSNLIIFAVLLGAAIADPNDFVDPQYAVASRGDFVTKDARTAIIRNGDTAAKKGPWTVTDSNIPAASNDSHDYLSWAPYHWPNCNWCGRANSADSPPSENNDELVEVHTVDEDSNERLLDSSPEEPPHSVLISRYAQYNRDVDWSALFSTNQDPGPAPSFFHPMGNVFDRFTDAKYRLDTRSALLDPLVDPMLASPELDAISTVEPSTQPLENAPKSIPTSLGGSNTGDSSKMSPTAREPFISMANAASAAQQTATTLILPTTLTSTPRSETTVASSERVYDHSDNPVRAQKPAKTTGCTTSPTTSMKPSETWKTCPYKPRDGQVNPDVRKLRNAAEMVDMSQTVLWNAIGSITSGSNSNAKNAAFFIDTFFLNEKTWMNPNVVYGQVVRGPPGSQPGSYMGVLDMRGVVKVVNAVLVLRETKSPYWTQDMDANMIAWASKYVEWVESSAAGQKAAKAANNHGSFYPNQIAALKILAGDSVGAGVVLQSYFANQFQEQIVPSGEQPLEAVRTRPFHYRCFNLEAIITNAKLGDYIGINFWDYKSKYGASIQTATDYLMSLDPKGEKVEEALPHVAAVAAAYGDPRGEYKRYLQHGNKNYMKKPFWLYDQPAAMTGSTTRLKNGARAEVPTKPSTHATEPDVQASDVDQDHPPELFSNGRLVELEEGLFVGWEDVREFYRKRRLSGERRRTRVKGSVPRQAPTPTMFQDGKKAELEDGIEVDREDAKEHYEPGLAQD